MDSASEKPKKRELLRRQGREIIRTMIREVKEEAQQGKLKHLLSETLQRVSTYSGKFETLLFYLLTI